MKRNNISFLDHSSLFVITNLLAKCGSGLAQIVSVFLFAKIHSPDYSAIIFVLVGYTIWLNIFEFGLSQSIQNKFNSKEWNLAVICRATLMHYVLMWGAAIVFVQFTPVPEILSPLSAGKVNSDGGVAFKIGLGMLIVAVNNVIIQRFLLISGYGIRANILMALQSFSTILVLFLYFFSGVSNIKLSVFLYIFPQLLFYLPTVFKIIPKSFSERANSVPIKLIIKECSGFWGLNFLSSVFLGMDYYFASKFMSSQEIVSFHFSSRFFFFSYVIYFSFAQFRGKKIGYLSSSVTALKVSEMVRRATIVGVLSVSMVASFVLVAGYLGGIDMVVGKGVFVPSVVLASYGYFFVRVYRDVRMLVLWNLGEKSFLAKLYALEICVGAVFLSFMVQEFGAVGVYTSMTLACVVSSGFISFFMGKFR